MSENKVSTLVLSKDDKKLEILNDSLALIERPEDANLYSIFEKICKDLAQQLLDIALNKEEVDFTLTISNPSSIQRMYIFRKKISEEKVFLEIRRDEFLNSNLEKEFFRIENEKINLCRLELKRAEEEQSFVQKKYFELLNEMSKLNNELLNTQRELYKKNIQLETVTNSLKELNMKLQKLALLDPLTGLYNRWYLYSVFNREITQARRQNYRLVMAFLDLNHFKFINDNFGHVEGDKLLKKFASILLKNVRKDYDYVFRFGGDEFLILFINARMADVELVMERIRNHMKEVSSILTFGCGLLEIDPNVDTNLEELLNKVDILMYEDKAKRKKAKEEK